MVLPPRLKRELDELQDSYGIEIVHEADVIHIIVADFPLGEGYNKRTSRLLLRVPRSYPDAGPDMFWVEPDVVLSSGAVPEAADSVESYIGGRWRRFSWHRQGGWHSTVDNLHSYLEFIRRRLKEQK
jgi:hypothetical protein